MLNLALLILFLLAAFCDAANKYVNPGGTGDGSSWSSAGSPGVINSSAAGDVIYLGGGSYGNGIAVQANSVTIKRATAADHGSDTGWSASLDKQATFDSGWLVSGSNVTIDGNCWKPPGLPTVFGFRIKHASAAKGIDAGGSPGGLKCIDLDIPGPGINSSKAEADGIHFPSNSTISGCAVYDTDALLFAWKGNSGTTIEYCYLYNASSNIVISGNPQDPHPDVIYSGSMMVGTMRYCVVANVTSEGVFFDGEQPGVGDMTFYGNVMFQGDCQTGNVPIQLQNGGAFGTVKLYHNTFVDFNKSNNLGPGTTVANGSAVVNNLYIQHLPNWNKGVDNNGFSSTGIGSNQIVNSASPFITSGTHVWTKGSGKPPATRVTTGAPVGYNPSGMETAFALADNSWAKGKGIAVPAGMNVDLYGNSGNNLGAIQGPGGGGGPSPTPPEPQPSPSASPSPVSKFQTGDAVTPTAVLNVRATPSGVVLGQHHPGEIGVVVSGPVHEPLKQDVAWYLIGWDTAPQEGYSGDDDLVKTTLPQPSPSPSATPPAQTWEEWIKKQNDWIRKNPPTPDQ